MPDKDIKHMLDRFEETAHKEHSTKAARAGAGRRSKFAEGGGRATALISLSKDEKDLYSSFAETHGMTVSSLARIALKRYVTDNEWD